jgi:hypothetical protein
MITPPRLSETEYLGRKPTAQVTTASQEGFGLDSAPPMVFTTVHQTVMNSQAQCLISGGTYDRQQQFSRGGYPGKTDEDMKKQNDAAIHLLATTSSDRYPYHIGRYEFARHNFLVVVRELNLPLCLILGGVDYDLL